MVKDALPHSTERAYGSDTLTVHFAEGRLYPHIFPLNTSPLDGTLSSIQNRRSSSLLPRCSRHPFKRYHHRHRQKRYTSAHHVPYSLIPLAQSGVTSSNRLLSIPPFGFPGPFASHVPFWHVEPPAHDEAPSAYAHAHAVALTGLLPAVLRFPSFPSVASSPLVAR